MSEGCNRYIRQALELARKLTILADEGEQASRDDGCAVLYGVVRDCAYKIRAQAQREREEHRALGMWEETAGDAESHASTGKEGSS